MPYVRKFYLFVAHLARQNSDGTWTTACSRTFKNMDDPTSFTAHDGNMCDICKKYFDKHGLKFIVKEQSTETPNAHSLSLGAVSHGCGSLSVRDNSVPNKEGKTQ